MSEIKILFVNFYFIAGELECLSHTILSGSGKDEDIIDKHFKNWYGKNEIDYSIYEKGYRYFYNNGSAVKVNGWTLISESERKFMTDLGVH